MIVCLSGTILLLLHKKMLDPHKKLSVGRQKKISRSPIYFFSIYGNGDTIRIGQEIQCLPPAGFFLN